MRNTVVAACAMLLAAASARAWELPLTVEEQWGQSGLRQVSGGVPLLPGQAKEPSELALVTKNAKGEVVPVPAQFKVLARWWRQDHSIRWVLVDFATGVNEFEARTFHLVGGGRAATPPAAPNPPARVEESDETVTVTTGPARFVIGRKRFAFLDHAYVDSDSDGRFTAEEDLLATTPDGGTVLEDTYGTKYFSSEGTKSVEVLDRGPVRVQVRARGQHRAPGGAGYAPGLYGYDVFLNFYAGSTEVSVDYVITNNPPKSTGSPTFEDASLVLRLAGGAKGYRLYGAAPLDGTLAAGESVCLYQDSNGAETWERCKGHYGPQTVAFRGYRVSKRSGEKDEVIAQGDQARGLTHLFNDQGGVIVHTRHFWQQFPKAVEVSADGSLRLALFPRESVVPHYLEDASAKGHELVLTFYSRRMKQPYAADTLGRPWPHVVADCWDSPLFPHPSLEHKAACGALTDLGPYTVPVTGFADYPLEIVARRLFMTDQYKGNGYGWQVWGERWDSHGGHSSRGARQPIKEDNFLYKWYTTGGRGWREVGNARSRHFRDVRCYRIDEQDPFGFHSWQAFSKANRSEDYCNRPQPTGEDYKKYTQGLWNRSTWWLPNPAHMTLDLCYDRYLLFGDQRSFENLRIIGGHGGNYVAYNRPFVHRETGWCWRTLERYWELTGDKDAEACLLDTLKTYEALIGKTPLVCAGETSSKDGVNWWFTQVFSRGVAMTALHHGDKRALDLVKTLTVGKEKQASYFCMLYAVAHHLTGDEQYKKVLLDATNGGRTLLTVGTDGDFPATAHWLVMQPPKGKP